MPELYLLHQLVFEQDFFKVPNRLKSRKILHVWARHHRSREGGKPENRCRLPCKETLSCGYYITVLGCKLGWTNESKRPQDCVVLGFACGEPRKEMKTNGNCGYVYDAGAAFVVPHRKDNDPPIPSVGGWWSQTIPSRPGSFSASTNMTSCHYETGTANRFELVPNPIYFFPLFARLEPKIPSEPHDQPRLLVSCLAQTF